MRAKYSDYAIVQRESTVHVRVDTDSESGRLARFHFRLARVPSTREIIVYHYVGSTDLERLAGLRSAVVFQHRGLAPSFLPHLWKRKRRTKGPGYWFGSPAFGYFLDEDAEFEALARSALSDGLSSTVDVGGFTIPSDEIRGA